MPQDPLISDLSLRENIAFGVPKHLIDDEKIYYCLKQPQLLDVCNSLPKGIYSDLGNKGINLSGAKNKGLQFQEHFTKIMRYLFLMRQPVL